MPIYEYRCPNGHTFELFQRMSDPQPSECQICGESPLEKVLYPAALHFKGSGFYKTDYASGSRKRDGDKADKADKAEKAESSEKKDKGDSKPEKKSDKKPAEA
jgi:putative FmdB family regulatory protein